MVDRSSEYIPFDGGDTHVCTWGNPRNPLLIMWHGLARTGRDFDFAARHLSQTYFVVCPDTIGRGLSSWAKDPQVEYSLTNYANQALSLVEHYEVETLRWFGTSMGALIGMNLAGNALKGRISHLVLNDVGPEVPMSAADRIVDYVGNPPRFSSMPAFEAWLRKAYAPFGENDDLYWRIMADSSARRLPDGQITTHYDPAITWQFAHSAHELPLWKAYDNIVAKTLLTRGAVSDVLPADLAQEMCGRGPMPRLEVFANCGHAPTFTTPKAIELLETFFL